MAQVRTRYGVLSVPDLQTDVIGKFLQHYGEWAWLETEFVASSLPPAAKILDIGAFVGTFSLGLASQASISSLVAVEANSDISSLLAENLDRNFAVSSIAINSLVVGDLSASRFRHLEENNLGGTSYTTELIDKSDASTVVDTKTLRQLCDQYGPFDLIKIDAEGAELEILQEDRDFIKSGNCTFWLECNETSQSLLLADLLLSCDLALTYFAFPSHNPDNFRGESDAIFPWAYEAGLLATSNCTPSMSQSLSRAGCILKSILSTEDLRRALWSTPRWGMPEWQGATPPEIVALSAHTLRGDNYTSYLYQDWNPGRPLWDRITELETVLTNERAHFAKVIRNADLSDESDEITSLALIERQQTFDARSQKYRNNREVLLEQLSQQSKDLMDASDKIVAIDAALTKANTSLIASRLAGADLERRLMESEVNALDRLGDFERLNEDFLRSKQRITQLSALSDEIENLETEIARLRKIEEQDLPLLKADLEARRHLDLERQELVQLYQVKSQDLDLVLRSTTWRVARRAHLLINNIPPLKGALVLSRRAGGRMRRSFKRKSK